MNNPKITVYITNYNYGKYIAQSIDSVLEQTEQSFELIIIDDGSTDNSKDIIERYSKNQKITIVYQKNKGLNVSNNIAMRVARGKYLIRLDADDYFQPDALMLLSAELDADEEIGLVFPDYYTVDNDNQIISEIRRHDFDEEVKLFDQPAHGACTMIRLDYLRNVGGYDESFSCQDGYDLWLKFTSDYKVKNVRTPLFSYRQHGANLTKNEAFLLSTRIEIKKKFLERKEKAVLRTIAIIPVRSLHVTTLCFEQINGKSLLEIKLDAALKTDLPLRIVVTSSDDEVFDFVRSKYNDERLVYVKRPKQLARYNASLFDTLQLIFEDEQVKACSPEAFVVLAIEYPFLNYKMIDNCIRSAAIFDADSVISVRRDNATHYKHDGKSLIPVDKGGLTKYERDDLYESKGGLLFSGYSNLLKNKKLPSGKVSHVIVDQISAFEVSSALDLKIAGYINSELIKP